MSSYQHMQQGSPSSKHAAFKTPNINQPASDFPLSYPPQRIVANVTPRSSSLPLTHHPMGSSPSKPDPPSPTTSAGATVKGIGAAVAGGIKHTLAFGTRRKKSEDASSNMNAVASQGPGQELESTRNPEVPKKSPPQQVYEIAQPSLAPQSPPLPPLPPQKEIPDHAPSSSAVNRSSMMVISPGISNAVNFMIEQTPSPAPLSAPPAPMTSSSPPSNMKESWRKSDSTNSHHTIRPGAARGSRPVSWAESFQSAYTVVPGSGGSSNGHGTVGGGNKRRSVLADDADFGMREEEGDYEDSSHGHEWSNGSSTGFSSTSSHSIITDSPPHRPRSRSNNRRSISVTVGSSGAYSPSSSSSSHRQSPPPPHSTSAKEMKKASYSFSEGVKQIHHQAVPPPASTRAPPGVSVTRTGQGQESFAAPKPIPTPAAATGLRSRFAAWTGTGSSVENERGPSPSNTKGVQRVVAPPVASSASTASMLNARQERGLPSLPPSSGLAPTSAAEVPFQGLYQHQQGQGQGYPMPLASSTSQSQPHSHHVVRPPAVSLTPSGFGPAAASLAKRTAEKVQRKLALALSSSGSPSHPNTSQEGLNSSPSIGSGYSSSSTTTTMSSGFSFGGGLVRTSSNTSAPSVGSSSGFSGQQHGHGHSHSYQQGPVQQLLGRHGGMGAFMHTASKSISVHRSNLSTSSTGAGAGSLGTADSDGYYEQPQGPMLGVPLRGALRTKDGVPFSGGGVVFGRDLIGCVHHTGIRADKARKGNVRQSGGAAGGVGGMGKEGLVKELEKRELPALVVRCAQHLLIWGVQEEGLFRVSGRPSHTTTLRAEFDAGVDYDMTACSPGDLDPHSVASVFKAFLRELPEPILTQRLQHLFDAAVKKETLLHANDPPASPQRMSMRPLGGGGSGLPPNPKLGFEAMRKRPSLSTLATPSFLDVPPPSRSLILTLRGLIAQLPQENRDLLRTVVDLIQATAQRSKQTKMPLGNLLVVFCPSLQMSPPLLKVLCEADGIWGEDVLDISASAARRREKEKANEENGEDIPPPTPTKDDEGDDYSDAQSWVEEDAYGDGDISSGRVSLDDPSSDYHAGVSASEESDSLFEVHRRPRWEEEERPEIPTVYLDSLSHCSSSRSSVALSIPDDILGLVPPIKAFHPRDPTTDSGSVSSGGGSIKMPLSSPPSSPPLSSSAESVTTPTSSNPSYSQLPLVEDKERGKPGTQLQGRQGRQPVIVDSTPLELKYKRSVIGNSIPVAEPVQFPGSNHNLPTTGSGPTRRRSIPILSLPSFSTPSFASAPVRPSSPADHGSPANSSPRSVASGLKNKKPSLKLLFSKRSMSSLSDKSGCGIPFISAPIPQGTPPPTQYQYQLKEDTMYLMTPKSSSPNDSSSSVSTPLSAVTAPQSTTSTMSNMSRLPPVLDTPIEGPSLSLELERFDVSPPDTADKEQRSETETLDPMSSPGSVQTPIASRYQPQGDRPAGPRLPTPSSRLPDEAPLRSLRSQMSTISLLSTSSSNHLNMFEEEDREEEDWASCVLMAAEKGAESSETAVSSPRRAGTTKA